jgi:hypothetical protein
MKGLFKERIVRYEEIEHLLSKGSVSGINKEINVSVEQMVLLIDFGLSIVEPQHQDGSGHYVMRVEKLDGYGRPYFFEGQHRVFVCVSDEPIVDFRLRRLNHHSIFRGIYIPEHFSSSQCTVH